MDHPAAYVLSSYSFIGQYSTDKLLDVGYHSKEGNPIPSFDENLLIELCNDALQIFRNEPNILKINGDITIVGDIHGSFHDLLRILKFLQNDHSKVLFLGDYVDRGNFSLECITILFALKVIYPDSIYLIRGNHEFDSICRQYGFYDEIINYHNPKKVKPSAITQNDSKSYKSNSLNFIFKAEETENAESISTLTKESEEYSSLHKEMDCYKYSERLYKAFIDSFAFLPLASIVNNTNICIHGGLSPHLDNLKQISKIIRPINDFEESKLFSDIVWSDPTPNTSFFFSENPRGRGCLFTRDSVSVFLNENSLNRLIRAHECVKHGTHINFHDNCITVFSASSYSKEINNESGILKLFESDNSIKFVTFPPIHRLEKSEAVYYKVQAFHEKNKHMCFSLRHPQLVSNSSLRMPRCKTVKHIKMQQSLTPQHKSKPFFASIKKGGLIQTPILQHSISMDNLDQSKKCNDGTKGKLRTLSCLNELPIISNV